MHSRPVGIRSSTRFCSLLLLAAGVVISCTENVGGLFGDNGSGGGGSGGGGGGNTSLPASVPVDGALILAGAPQVVGAWPVSQAIDLDVQSPVSLWFSESVNLSTVKAGLELRPRGSAGSVGYSVTGVAGDRGVILVPDSFLIPATEYELVANDDLSDLSGTRLKISGSGVLTRFTTAALISGVPPQVLASFPPNDQENVGNDHPLVLIFSKPIDFTGVSAAVTLTADGGAANFAMPVSSSSDRIVEFEHEDDDLDLDAAMQVFVDTTITDVEFSPNFLANTWSAAWTTLNFAPPSGLDIGAEPAANLANLESFPCNVSVGSSALIGDQVFLEIWGFFSSAPVSSEGTLANNGPTQEAFLSDLTDGSGTALLADGSLALAAWVERGTARSTVRLNQSFVQDTFPPSLVNFGPPVDSIASRFRTDLPEARPYGFASEPVSQIQITHPLGGSAENRNLVASPSGFFVGPSFGFSGALTESFEVLLFDVAGNPMPDPVQGTALFRGFVGSTPATGTCMVEAFDARTLEPLPNALIYVETSNLASFAPGQRGEESALTGTNGRATFTSADRAGAQTVTVIAAGYHTVSVIAVDSSFLSLPLREISPPTVTVSASIANLAGGTVRLASPMVLETDGSSSADALQDRSFSGMTGIRITPDRPGWWGGFHDVQSFPAATTYFNLFSSEPRLILDATPGSGSPIVFPAMAFVQASNATAGTTDYFFQVNQLTTGAGFNLPLANKTLATVSVLPGLAGVAATGVGEIQGVSGAAEMEILLQLAAESLGALEDQTLLQLWAADSSGDQALTRSSQVVAPAGATIGVLALPDVALPIGPTSAVTFPSFALSISDTLDDPGDWYHLRLADNGAPAAEWDIWVANPDSNSAEDSVILPGLAPAVGSGSDAPPLQVSPGSTWSFQVAAFRMPAASFPTAEGAFFAQLFRDCLDWSQSVSGSSFPVQ